MTRIGRVIVGRLVLGLGVSGSPARVGVPGVGHLRNDKGDRPKDCPVPLAPPGPSGLGSPFRPTRTPEERRCRRDSSEGRYSRLVRLRPLRGRAPRRRLPCLRPEVEGPEVPSGRPHPLPTSPGPSEVSSSGRFYEEGSFSQPPAWWTDHCRHHQCPCPECLRVRTQV